MIRNKFIKSSALPVVLFSATLAFGVSPIYNKVYAATLTTQQANTIKGKVIDQNGEPVIGATILVVGQNASSGAISDIYPQHQMGRKGYILISIVPQILYWSFL